MAPVRPPDRKSQRSNSSTASSTITKASSRSNPTTSHSLSSTTNLRDPYAVPHKKHRAPIKAEKRASKHATLLSRLHAPASASKITKRRRPGKKLVATLDGLADALPDHLGDEIIDRASARRNDKERGIEGVASGAKIKHTSLKSRPGAGKRKEKLMALERERFAKNMALMAAGSADSVTKGGKSDGGDVLSEQEMGLDKVDTEAAGSVQTGGSSKKQWAAIRSFIEQTMERRVP
ncbi:MAG: hypothetical protein Q9163_003875 [Psora crenata]